MGAEIAVTNPLVRYILTAVERYGLPPDELLPAWREAEGHPPERSPTSDDLTPLFRAMARLRPGDADLGLHVGERVPLRAFNPVIYLVLSSSSLARSIGAAIRFAELLEGRASKLWTRPRGDTQVVGWSDLDPGGAVERHHHEFIAVALVKAFEFLRDAPVSLAAVRFQHPHPGRTEEHRRLLGCAPTFGHPDHSAVLVSAAVWSGRTAHADPEVARMQEAMLEQARARLRESEVEARVRRAVIEHLGDGVTLAGVARALAMSERSLQRRLSAAGSSFREVVDDARRGEVTRLLETTDASIEAIALQAGFSDASSLHRAFSRWMGETPQAWRGRKSPSKGRFS